MKRGPIAPVTKARRAHAALVVTAALLVAVDVLVLAGRVVPGGHSAPRCGPQDGSGRSGTPSSLLWLRLRDGRTTPLVTGPVGQLNHPSVSPDGRMLAFLSHGTRIRARLQVCDLARHTTHTILLSVPAANFALSWSRRGRELVFLGGDALGWGADQRPFVVEPSGKGLRQVAGNSPWYYDGVALSPDGTKLALLLQWKYPHGREPEQLAVLDIRSGHLERVAGSSQVAQIDAISWAPDGRRIVLTGYRQNAHGALYVVDVATKRLTPLLVRGPGASTPAWSPDGRSVAYVRGRGASSSIWLVDVASGHTRQLTAGGGDLAPAWSPDGKALVFVRRAVRP